MQTKTTLDDLLERLRNLQFELEQEVERLLAEKRAEFRYTLRRGKVVFERSRSTSPAPATHRVVALPAPSAAVLHPVRADYLRHGHSSGRPGSFDNRFPASVFPRLRHSAGVPW